MEKKIIKLNSYLGVDIENEYINQGSEVLTVILPGLGYLKQAPLLHYSYKIAMELEFDVISIEYGFQASRKSFNQERDFNAIVRESKEVLNKCLSKKYQKILFIGKSLGTVVQSKVCEEVAEDYKQIHVYLTPIDKTIENMVNTSCLVVTGTKDVMISKESISKIEENKKFKILKIEDGNHSLEVPDVLKSIEILNNIMKTLKEFIINEVKI